MIPASGRHALPAIFALCLLAIPIAYHSLARPRVDDCSDPARLRLPDFLPLWAGFDPPPVKAPRQTIVWNNGDLRVDGAWIQTPKWRIVRAYNLEKFYFAPLGLFTQVYPEDRRSIAMREANGVDLPIHLLVNDSDGFLNVAAYLYVFAGRPVRHPAVASLRNAFRQLAGGTLPMTLILIEGNYSFDHARENEEILVDWIRSAWIELERVCRS